MLVLAVSCCVSRIFYISLKTQVILLLSFLSWILFCHHCCLIHLFKNFAATAKSLHLCLTLCDPIDSSPPGKNTGVGCHFLLQCMKVKSESEVAQSCLTLCDPMDRSLPGSSVHGIFQARVLEWVCHCLLQPVLRALFKSNEPIFLHAGLWYGQVQQCL